jgi:hypothetical protein
MNEKEMKIELTRQEITNILIPVLKERLGIAKEVECTISYKQEYPRYENPRFDGAVLNVDVQPQTKK